MHRYVVLIGLLLAGSAAALPEELKAAPAELHADHPLNGTLWDTRSATRADEKALFAEAAKAEWVLLGEKHDNAEHHRLQARVIDELGRRGRRVAVVWEMAEPEHAEALRRANLDTVDDLGRALSWEKRGWPDWREYQPVAEAALIHRMPMLPGKPGRDLVRRVGRGGPLPENLPAELDLSRRYPPEVEAALLEELAISHCGALPEEVLPAMVAVQRFWDAWMAAAMRRARALPASSEGAVLIAGSGHVRKDRAVPWHLNGKSLTLALVEVVPGYTEATDYPAFDPALFDYVWFTPRVDDKDPCEAFAKPAAKETGKSE